MSGAGIPKQLIDKATDTEMRTKEFLSALRRAPDKPLLFADVAGHVVQRGYRLTEIKAANFDTIDCGGQANHWRETILQLWVPKDAERSYMTAAKFLKIFDKVSERVPLDSEAEIRVEYGDDNIFPSTYHVRSVMYARGGTCVQLEPPATTCKARDRRLVSTASNFCCDAATPTCCAS